MIGRAANRATEVFPLTALFATRVFMPIWFVAMMWLVIRHGAIGFAAVIVLTALAGYGTELFVRHRENRGIAGLAISEHRLVLDDGLRPDETSRETSVRPGPTKLLASRYASAWSSRSESVVRVSPPFWRALSADLLGLVLGTLLFLAVIVLLTHL